MKKEIERECQVHGMTVWAERKDGGFRCRKCLVDAVTKRRKDVKLKLVEYAGGCCKFCGYTACIGALHFHHKYNKEFAISRKGNTRSWEKMKKEVDKCVLVCANCHAEIHAGLRNVDG